MRLRCIPPTCFFVYFLRAVLPGFGSLPAGILPSRLTGLSCCFVAVVKNPPPSKKKAQPGLTTGLGSPLLRPNCLLIFYGAPCVVQGSRVSRSFCAKSLHSSSDSQTSLVKYTQHVSPSTQLTTNIEPICTRSPGLSSMRCIDHLRFLFLVGLFLNR